MKLTQAILAALSDAAIVIDPTGAIVGANASAEALLGYPEGELAAVSIDAIAPEGLLGEVVRRRDGTPVEVVLSTGTLDDGAVLVTLRDVTLERRTARQLSDAETIAQLGVWDWFIPTNTVTWSDQMFRMLGHEPGTVDPTYEAWMEGIHPDDRERVNTEVTAAMAERRGYEFRHRVVWPDGRITHLHCRGQVTLDEFGEPLRIVGASQEVTEEVLRAAQQEAERRRYEGQLQYLADHDSLTGLCNRRRFELEVAAQESYAARYGGTFSLLLLDIDNFKDVNDTRGHRIGDDLICSVARVLAERVRSADVLARLGGDEFAVLLPATDTDGARALAEELRAAVRGHSLVASGHRLRVTVSIGVAVHDGSPGAAERLLADADVAMYDAKDAGRDRVSVAEPEHGGRDRMEARYTWAARLRRALDHDQLLLYAQPILEVASDRITQYELLLRMRADDGTIVPPGAFLATAERHGLIREVDHWVVRRAIELAGSERAAGRRTRLEVNLSARSIGDPELPELVATELARTGADAGQLIFEVTETAAIDSMQEAQALVARLGALGCGFALDDFGAGFSSFTYLKHLAVDYIKIDGEFIQSITRNETDQLVVQALVAVCRGLGRHTIAEFVEDCETETLLRTYGVDLLQGFHIGHPGPVDQVLAGLRSETAGVAG